MLWIGLTGGIATGKSTVSRLLRARGYAVIDADQLSREVVQIGTEAHREIASAFGPDAISDSGELDRKKIGAIVFSDRSKLALLESIIHPRVRRRAQELRDELAAEGREVAFYDVPLLFEKNMKGLFDRTVVVACSPETQLRRLILRDGFPEEEAKRRVASQIPIAEKTKLADDVIRNEGGMDELEKAVGDYLAKLHHAQT